MKTIHSLFIALIFLFSGAVHAFDLDIRGGHFVGYYKNFDRAYAWTVYSPLWNGPRLAFCAQPHTPLHTGVYRYSWSGSGVSRNVSSYLSRIDEMPRNYAQRAVHHLLKGEVPTWMERGPEIKTWLFKHPTMQNILVVDLIPTPGLVPMTYAVPNSSDELFLSIFPTEVPIYLRTSSVQGRIDTDKTSAPNPVPIPGTAWLLLSGLGLLWRFSRA